MKHFPLVTATLLGSIQLHAATLTVTNTNDSLAGSLRQAIQDAASGDTIVFNIPPSGPGYDSATKTWTIMLTSAELPISRNLTIDGQGQKIVIQRSTAMGTPNFRIFNITAGTVTVARLTITNGVAPDEGPSAERKGGGVRNGGVLTLLDCAVNGNRGQTLGGGLYNTGTAMVISCTFTGNGTDGGGGAIYNGGTITLTSCTIVGNSGIGAPPGVQNAGTAQVGNSVIAGNSPGSPWADVVGPYISQGYNFIGRATGPAGAGDFYGSTGFGLPGSHDQVGSYESPADPKLGPFQDNGGPTQTFVPLPGPLIDQGNSFGLTTDQRGRRRPIDDSAIVNAGDGADIGAVESDVLQVGPNFVVNTTDEHSDQFCGVQDCSLWDAANAADNNAANNSVITFAPGVTGSITTALQAEGIILYGHVNIIGPGARALTISGAGVARAFHIFGDVTISGLTLAGSILNSGNGGAILNEGGLTVIDGVFSGNQTFSGNGGAIFNAAGHSLTLNRCTFFFNHAPGGGGAIRNEGTLTATNCTFANNTADGGAAVSMEGGGATETFLNCTISGNNAQSFSGGLDLGGAPGIAHLGNTIVAGNSAGNEGPDLRGTYHSDGNNIIGNASGSSGFTNGTNGDQVGVDPKLGPVADNGGSTPTMALQPSSPAINAANPATAPPTDQRGFFRAGLPDIGAFELNGTFFAANLQNISTRGFVGTGDNVLIGGIIIDGSGPKRVLVRALGPTLGQLGVHNALANPTLELYTPVNDTQTLLASNDNWMDASNHQEITATGLAPPNNLEAAILADLNPGNYTAIVRGVNGATGNALVDAYDLNETVPSRFGNISTRGFVQAGDSVMIAGVIINGAQSQNVLIRALGPTLSQFGVHNVLANPMLQLVEPNGMRITNDNWGDAANASGISATGLAPPNNLESAILIRLPVGQYTAILSGVNGTIGNALLEVYALP
jgi:hypothetical protein